MVADLRAQSFSQRREIPAGNFEKIVGSGAHHSCARGDTQLQGWCSNLNLREQGLATLVVLLLVGIAALQAVRQRPTCLRRFKSL